MTVPQSTTRTADASLWRDGLHIARYYLGNRWGLLLLGSLAVIIGLYFGGWGWLVAAGLAPILLSTLPCLVMCALGLCMMGRSGEKQSTASRDTGDSAQPAAPLGVVNMDRASVGGASCCHEDAGETQSPQVKQVQPIDERRDSHA